MFSFASWIIENIYNIHTLLKASMKNIDAYVSVLLITQTQLGPKLQSQLPTHKPFSLSNLRKFGILSCSTFFGVYFIHFFLNISFFQVCVCVMCMCVCVCVCVYWKILNRTGLF